MELHKDGITMDVNSKSQEMRLRRLGYIGKGETPMNNEVSVLQEELNKKDAEIQRLTRQIERLKKGQ